MDAKVISDLRKAEIEQMQIEIMGYKKREVKDIERITELEAEVEKKQAVIDEQKEYCRQTGNDYQAKQIEVMELKQKLGQLEAALEKIKYCAGTHTVSRNDLPINPCGFEDIYNMAGQALKKGETTSS